MLPNTTLAPLVSLSHHSSISASLSLIKVPEANMWEAWAQQDLVLHTQ